MKNIQNFFFLLYFFSINFEQWDIFNTEIDFLITKITVSLYLISTMASFNSMYSLNNIKKNVLPIFFLFSLMTLMNYLNKSSDSKNIFNIAFLLPIILLIPMYNQSIRNENLILKGLFSFSISAIIITLFAYIGIFSTVSNGDLDGNRLTVFNNNQNDLGLRLVIAIFILFFAVYKNLLKLGKFRYLYLIFIPHVFYFVVQTGSRVAFISFLLGLFVIITTIDISRWIKIFFIVPILLFSAILIYGFILSDSDVVSRLSSSINDGDLSQRDLIWAASIELIYDNPLFGIGQTGFVNSISDALYGVSTSPHNVFIEVFCYTGLFGFTLFLLFIIPIIKYPFYINSKTNNYLPLLFLIPLFGVLMSGQLFGSKTFFLIILYIITSKNIIHYKKIMI